jgi:type IV conjugative transfer system coupling protein TraD
MLVQLIKPLMRWGAIGWIFITLSISSNNINNRHINYTVAYLKAKFYMSIYAGEEPVSIGNSKTKAKHLINNSRVKYFAYKTFKMVKQNGFVAFWVVIAGWILAIIYFSVKGYKLKQPNFMRGREITNGNDLEKIVKNYNRGYGYDSPYTIAGIPYPAYCENRHTMIAGASGSGKSVLISSTIEQVIERGDKAIIYDLTGDFTASFYDPSKDVILNPFDSRSRGWSLIEEAQHVLEFDTIAQALIGEEEGSGKFWSTGARIIMSELCKRAFMRKNFSTRMLVEELFDIELRDLNEMLVKTPAYTLTDPENRQTTVGLLATLNTYISSLMYVKEEKENFSIRDWITNDEQKGCIFLTTRSNVHSSLVPLLSVMMDVAITSLMTLNKCSNRKVWFIFDELASLNALPSLERGLTITRNFGGCFVLGIQAISQLKQKYGRSKADTLSSNCNTKVILNTPDADTARWGADIIGTQEAEQVNEGVSYGANELRDGVNIGKIQKEKNLILASEIASLPPLNGYLVFGNEFPIAKISYPYKKWEKKHPGFISSFFNSEEDNKADEDDKHNLVVSEAK